MTDQNYNNWGRILLDILAYARHYVELGYPVFPCAPNQKYPMVDGGFHAATLDLEKVREWFTTTKNANVAIPTAGLLVVDIDNNSTGWPNDPDRAADLANTPTARTPRGGRHHWFRQPDGFEFRNTTGKLAPGVDTRADGGYVLVAPSIVDGKGYEWIVELDQSRSDLPDLFDWLAKSLATGVPKSLANDAGGNEIPPGQRNHTLARLAGGMRRMGMGSNEIRSALLSANEERCKPSLETEEVERIAASISRYEPDQITVAIVEDWSGQDAEEEEPESEPEQESSGDPPPAKLLRVPGLVERIMDYTMTTAPYPNQVLAFAGALAMQSFLAARKVRDSGDNRTNLYIIGLANSASGKDWPRKVNVRILEDIGLGNCHGDRFASGEGIQDAIERNPALLFQTDEIDGMLTNLGNGRESRWESIMSILLSLYSASNSSYPIRAKAGKDAAGSVNQPSLTLFGTAIPQSYYDSLSERMLVNGFFARSIVLESEKRAPGQEPTPIDIPAEILEIAAWWRDYRPCDGNLTDSNPVPAMVTESLSASDQFSQNRLRLDGQYCKMEACGDAAAMATWGRAQELTRKLALIFAVSENYDLPQVSAAGVRWAAELVDYCVRRMLRAADQRSTGSDFESTCRRILGFLRRKQFTHSALLRKSRLEASQFAKVVSTLTQTGEIEQVATKTRGRPSLRYRIRRGDSHNQES